MWARWLRAGLGSRRITTLYPRGSHQALAGHGGWRPFPEIAHGCEDGSCADCAALCPTEAITLCTDGERGVLRLDIGACIACGRCVAGCPAGTFVWSGAIDRAAANRPDLIRETRGGVEDELRP